MFHRESLFQKISLATSATVAIALIIFAVLRAQALSFTHDEAISYLHYVHMGFFDILSMRHPFTNNHILNTLLMKYSEELFGNSELSLRLPNILALCIYCFYLIRFFWNHNRSLVLPFLLVCTMNPYLLDFFALARGYGLSIAFMVMSIFHLCEFIKNGKAKDLVLYNSGALLASLANLTLLNYYFVSLFILNLFGWFIHNRQNSEQKKFFAFNKINILFFFLFVAVFYEPLRRMVKKNMLDFGGKNGFFEDTLGSIINDIHYNQAISPALFSAIRITLSFTVLVIFLLFLFKCLKRDFAFIQKNSALVICNLLLMLIAWSSILQHYILGNDYYVSRFALFIYPLLCFNLIFFLPLISPRKPIISATIITVLAFILTWNCLSHLNLKYSRDWAYDADTKTVMALIKNEHEKKPGKISLGICWLFEPSTNFYRYTWNLDWIYPTNRTGPAGNNDYYYYLERETVPENAAELEIMARLETSGAVLSKK